MADLPISKDSKKLAFVGAGLLAIGPFMPVVSVPIVGNLNLFNGGEGDGIILLVLAGIGAVLAYLGKTRHVLWPGLAAAAMLLYGLVRFQQLKSQMRADMDSDLEDNPFKGLAELAIESVQLQWGWFPLVAGAGIMIYAGWLGRNSAEPDGKVAADSESE